MKKKLSILLAALMVGATFIGCGSKGDAKSVPTADIAEAVKAEVEIPALGPVEEELVKEVYHINLDEVEEYTIENCMRSPGIGVLAIVKAKDGKVDAVKASLEKALEEKKASAFYPGEAEAYDAGEVKAFGNYVALVIVGDEEEGQNNVGKAMGIIENKLK